MLKMDQLRKKYLAYGLAFAASLVLIAFTFVKFMVIPYIGFIFNPSDGSIIQVFVTNQSGMNLRNGDRLIKVGAVNFEDFKAGRRIALFDKEEAGEIVEIHVLRNGQELTIPWTLPGPNRAEIVDRINSVLWLAYAFWLAGIATILIIRPRDMRWLLMVAFYLLTATWLASGSISAGRVWEGAILLRMSIWMSVPVYLHFHWLFPRPLKNLPPAIWWSIYLVATILAGLEWFEVLPESTYYFGFLFALLGSLGLLIFRALSQPEQRGDVRFLAVAAVFAMMPALLLSVTGVLNRYPWFGGLALLGLPVLPGAYFYTVYSRQIGGLRFRTNRLIALYVFFVLVGTPSAIGIPFLVSRVESPEFAAFLGVLASLLIVIVSIAVFPPFQRFFEHRILGIPLPPTHLLSTYSSRITTSLSLNSLQHILRDEILPSLLVRQSALLQVNEHDRVSLLYSSGVDSIQVPSGSDSQLLLEQVGNQGVISSVVENQAYRWVRLVLPLNFEGKHIGLWLLGSRDPDDLYPPAEISVLETIANHTAIALVNINQAERLRMLYISNIERQEIERTSLARGLHDEVLNQLASLSMSVAQDAVPEFHKRYNKVASRIRQMVSNRGDYSLIPDLF